MVSKSAAVMLMLACGVAMLVAAQPPAPCANQACTSAELWAGAASIHQLKNEFVAALRDFVEVAVGSYGDEGPLLLSTLDAAQRSLSSWDQAIAAYEMALRATPGTAESHAALGSVYLDRARLQDSLREFRRATDLDPQRPDAHELSALAYETLGDSKMSALEFERTVAVAPDNLSAWYRLAQAVALVGLPAKAQEAQRRLDAAQPPSPPPGVSGPSIRFDRISLLRQPAGLAPIFPPQAYVPGFRLLDVGRYSEALTSLHDAAASDPLQSSAPGSAARLAGATLRRGQWQAALSRLRAAGEQSASDAETQRLIGVAYWANEEYEKSLEAFSAAVRLNPRDERSRIALADVYVAAAQPMNAEGTLKDTIRLMPESGLAHYRLAQLYRSQSLLPAAIDEFEQAMRFSPLVGLDNLFETIGGLYVTQANFDSAVSAYRHRIDVNPNNAEAHRKLGEIYALQGENDAALAEFAVTRWLDPGGADAHAASGQVYLRLNRYADAVSASRDALQLDPQHQKARFTLGTALMRLGETTDGQRELDRFQQEVVDSNVTQQHVSEVNRLRSDAARFLAANNYEAAIADLRKALVYASGDVQAYLSLGNALMKAGQSQEALDTFLKARETSETPDVHRCLAEAYAALGRSEDRDHEAVLFQRLTEQSKEERLKKRPLLR
jgi:tetratricopeptide (TPR) repeat protein